MHFQECVVQTEDQSWSLENTSFNRINQSIKVLIRSTKRAMLVLRIRP
jgi:hypothetical protein